MLLTQLPLSAAEAQTVFAGEPASVHFDPTPHIGPDALSLRYEYQGRWLASAGGEFVIVGVTDTAGALGVSLGGLLELSNESSTFPVPSQLLRAVVFLSLLGANSEFEISEKHRGQVYVRLGFFHESDHGSAESLVRMRLERARLSLDNFSSYEYLRLAGVYRHEIGRRVTLTAGLGLRLFTPPINAEARREQSVGLDLEVSAEYRVGRVAGFYVAAYWDGTANSFPDDQFPNLSVPTFAQTFRAELGLRLRSAVGVVDVYGGTAAMDGRGIDFADDYGPAFLLGIRGSI